MVLCMVIREQAELRSNMLKNPLKSIKRKKWMNVKWKIFLNMPSPSKPAYSFENELTRKVTEVQNVKDSIRMNTREKANMIRKGNKREFGREIKKNEVINKTKKQEKQIVDTNKSDTKITEQKSANYDNKKNDNNQSLSEFFPSLTLRHRQVWKGQLQRTSFFIFFFSMEYQKITVSNILNKKCETKTKRRFH